jgi:bifunctional non-homologous end joining protein LigD
MPSSATSPSPHGAASAKRAAAAKAARPPARAASSRGAPPPTRPARARPPAADDADAPLARYRAKRDFAITSEPGPETRRVEAASPSTLAFVIQKHDATRLHYDFRLELDGVLLSWAVPKGPSFDPSQKRLAMHVEDHPVAYAGFEGTIPAGQYGAGTVLIWDEGTWEPVGDPRAGLKDGKLVFRLHGRKLAGLWELVRIAKPGERQEAWLLFKKHDEWERPHDDYDVTVALPDSVRAKPLPMLEDGGAAPAPAPAPARKAAPKPRAKAPRASAKAARETPPAVDVAALEGARRARMPDTLEPQLATLAKAAPAEGDWVYEIKFDGYRLLVRLQHGEAAIFTRGGHDWTHKLPALAREFGALGLADAWIDGEAVVLDEQGHPRFNLLQNALDASRSDAVVFYAFDLPYADGHDLRRVPLHARRDALKALLDAHGGERVRFSADFPADAGPVLAAACGLGLEGVIAKRRDSHYASTRNRDWLKLKCEARQEFVIAGFSDRADNAKAVGALSLGVYDEKGELQYAGRVGTGWSQKEAVALRTRLAKLIAGKSPFPNGATRSTRWMTRPAASDHWVEPKLVAEIRFAEWTPDGSVRHASWVGLREDKPAREVVRERSAAAPGRDDGPADDDAGPDAAATRRPAAGSRARRAAGAAMDAALAANAAPPARARARAAKTTDAAEVAGVRITHPDRVIDAASGHTKLELARYYESVADWILPHLKGRPVSLVRAPDGVGGELFFQKHAEARTLPGVRQLEGLWAGHGPLLEIADLKGLLAAAQMNVVELHTWNSVKRSIDRPDRVVFDLDPGEGVKFDAVREGAQLVRALLEELGLQCWLKTSGGKGLHVVVPLAPKLDYDTVKGFSQHVVQHLAQTIPQRFVAKSGAPNRVGKIFVDWLRNGFNATTAAAFSARARPGLGVSMPIAWDELPEVKSGAQWTISNARDRLSFQKADPWAGYARCRQTLAKAMKALAG